MGGKPSHMEGKMHLSGKLSDWSIGDLLQIMQVTEKTGSLDIDGERQGRVHFREGRVTGAELTGVKGSTVGVDRTGVSDILYVLSNIEEGSFSVGAADGPEVKGWTVEELVTDVEALRTLEGEVVDSGLFEATGVRIVPEIPEPIIVEPEDWHVFVNLAPAFTFERLETRHGRGSAIRVFHTLHRLGLAEAFVGEEGETDWLNRLAEDVAPGSAESAAAQPPVEDEDTSDDADADEPAAVDETEVVELEEPAEVEEPPVEPAAANSKEPEAVKGVSAPASTTLTDGVYDEIRRLRSRVSDS